MARQRARTCVPVQNLLCLNLTVTLYAHPDNLTLFTHLAILTLCTHLTILTVYTHLLRQWARYALDEGQVHLIQ
jgi:hypothetical protein